MIYNDWLNVSLNMHVNHTHTCTCSLAPVDGSAVYVDNTPVTETTVLRTGANIEVGDCRTFRFVHPDEVKKRREAGHTPNMSRRAFPVCMCVGVCVYVAVVGGLLRLSFLEVRKHFYSLESFYCRMRCKEEMLVH